MLKSIKIIFNFFIAYKPIFLYTNKKIIKYKNFFFIFLFLFFLKETKYHFNITKQKKKVASFLNAPNRNKKAQIKIIFFCYNILLTVSYKIIKKQKLYKSLYILYTILFLRFYFFESNLLLLQNRTINFFFYEMNKKIFF